MKISELRRKLLVACEQYTISQNKEVVIPEAYIPYIPENWNGVLVLFENQNLSDTNKSYVYKLKDKSPIDKYLRLNTKDKKLHIQPWDDGDIELALECMGFNPKHCAVSNAVPWSLTHGKRNVPPKSKSLQLKAAEFLDNILVNLEPNYIITIGSIAKQVVNKTYYKGKRISLSSTSPRARSGYINLFNKEDLLERYPEVKRVVAKSDKWKAKHILIACAAVSKMNVLDLK